MPSVLIMRSKVSPPPYLIRKFQFRNLTIVNLFISHRGKGQVTVINVRYCDANLKIHVHQMPADTGAMQTSPLFAAG